jgi:hypothetical protein
MASKGNGAAAGGAGAVYGLGLLGAFVWNWQVADTFWGYPWGVIESFFWPGFLVYEAFKGLSGMG